MGMGRLRRTWSDIILEVENDESDENETDADNSENDIEEGKRLTRTDINKVATLLD